MKKFISIILVVIIALSVSVTTFAAYDDECDCGYVPVICVTGFAMTPLEKNAGTDEAVEVFFPEAGPIISCVAQLIIPIALLLVSGDYNAFCKQVCLALNNLLADLKCDDSGVPVNDTVDVAYRFESKANHSAYTESTFCYDWREDVFDIAAELNDYVEKTKELTGHDKVALKAISMGGAVLMTYLKVYGSDSVDSVIMQSSAYNGISLMGGLYTGDIDIKSQSVMNYIGDFIEGNTVQINLARALFFGLGNSVISPVSSVLDKAIKSMQTQLYDDCLKDLIGNIPGLWTFVPQENYEDAKAYMLDKDENAELIKKIDKYHYGVMDKTKELLDSVAANGAKIAIVSNYGKAGVPVNTYDEYQSDFLIDTKRTSLGATCADFGLTLGEDYVQAVSDGHNHLSCDGMIDASTCMYPEYTWFVKDMMHTWYTSGYESFIYWLAYSDEQPTVWTSSQYPQFLFNNQETNTLDVLTPENQNNISTQVDFSALVELIVSTVKK